MGQSDQVRGHQAGVIRVVCGYSQTAFREFPSLAMSLRLARACQITSLDLSGPRGVLRAAEALATQCPELAEEADISPKWGISRFDPMYGPAVRRKRFRQLWLMRSCINVSGFRLEHIVLRAIMNISAHAILLPDKPRGGCLGHQCSHAPGRPILHCCLILSQTSAGKGY